ncbi:Ig-like domain-containing protein [Rossellomorea vietnamensis]|uniref:Ig-like domain-containing protein n=1 Tax=Rossellomorea vietnamensis TaxID=218284 RepID=UPI003CFA5FEE
MRRIVSSLIVFVLCVALLPMAEDSAVAASDSYYPKLYDVYFGNDDEVAFGETVTAYARVDNNGYEVSKIRMQMKDTASMATFVMTMEYDPHSGQWMGQRKIDEPSWAGSSWVAERIIVEDKDGHSRMYSQDYRYYIGQYFNWNDLTVNIHPLSDDSQVEEKTYQGTEWKNRVIDLTSDYTNDGTLIIEDSTINSNGFDFINNGTIILKGKNVLNVKDNWDGYRGIGEVILHSSWFQEIGSETAATPRVNRVTNENSDVITGYGEIGAAVSIYNTNQDQLYGTAIVGEDGRFSVQLADKLEGGSFSDGLFVSMKGQAPEAGHLYAQVWDVIAPNKPELYTVNELTTKLKGSTNEYSTIFIKRDYNSKPLAQGYTDDSHQFSIDIPKQEAGDQFIVTAIDYDGNESELRYVTVAPKGDPTELSGEYSDTVLFAEDSPYLVNGEVTFTNQMVKVEPGVEFIAKDGTDSHIEIGELMYAVGREDAPIRFREVPVSGVKGYFNWVEFLNLNKNNDMGYNLIKDLTIYDSRVINTTFLAATGKIERSLFLNSPLEFKGTGWTPWIRENTFVMDTQEFERAGKYYKPILNIYGYGEIPVYAIKSNHFITPESLPNIISYRSPEGSPLDLTNNYWGTTDLNTIKQIKLGGDDNILVDPISQVKPEGALAYSLPAEPVVEAIKNADRVVRGKGAPDHTVNIIMDKAYNFTVETGSDGTFTYQISHELKKDTKIQVYQLDQNGVASTFVTVPVIDNTPPKAPEVSQVTELSDVVTGTAEVSSTIEVRVSGTVIGTGEVTSRGSFTVAIAKQKAGTILEVTAVDDSGNVSEKTSVDVKDVTAPASPQVNEVTDKDTVVTGGTEPGAKIEVQRSGSVIGSQTARADGKFSVTIPVQKAGAELAVIAADQAGNVSGEAIAVVKDITAPAKPVVFPVLTESSSVSGEAEPGSTVKVRASGTVIGTGTTDESGYFDVSIQQQKAGTALEVTATDKSGNVSEKAVITVMDETAPAKPEVNEVTDKDTILTGKTEPGAEIEVGKKGLVISSGTAGADGKFSLEIPVQKAGEKLEVSATDQAGNKSEAAIIIVKDATAPAKPKVFAVNKWDTSIRGEAEPNAAVEVRVAGTVIGTGETDIFGSFSVMIPQQKAGTKLLVVVRDQAGNTSKEAVLTVIDGARTIVRISGANRMDTAIEIAKRGWQSADTVVISTGDDFPDALAGAPLAYKLDAPILLSNSNGLSDSTKQKITDLGATKAFILGGTKAVPTKVQDQLKSLGIKNIERLAGANRFETAGLIAERLGGTPSTAILAYGENYPDALSVASYAAQNGFPILLTKTDSLPAATSSQLNGKTKTIVVGGEGAISKKVLEGTPGPKRIGGTNRFETAANITKELNLSTNMAYIATGRNFADALTGSVLAAKGQAPVLLVEQNSVPAPIYNLIQAKDIPSIGILGGKSAVSEEVEEQLKK